MRIAFLGDIAFFGRNTSQNKKYKELFAPIRKVLETCDYVIANLECPLTLQSRIIGGKSAYLKGDPRDIEILKYIGITHVTLANNHIFDYRAQGMTDTIKLLDENGIEWYGVNNKKGEIVDGESHLALMGYCCYSTNAKGLENDSQFVDVFDPSQVESDIAESISKGMLPILSIHWGQEHVHYPNYDHIEAIRKLCKGKRVIVHGHHPHVIQGIENIDESLIAYSLGNFCFDDVYTKKSNQPLVKLSKDNQESFILVVNVEKNDITGYEIVPFSFENRQYQIKEDILDKIKVWSDFLDVPKEEYVCQRTKDLTSYINARKELRNFEWYFRRLNLESVKMILGSKHNSKRYNTLVKSYIS